MRNRLLAVGMTAVIAACAPDETADQVATGEAVDEFTGCPEYKVCAVRIEKLPAQGSGAASDPAKAGAAPSLADTPA